MTLILMHSILCRADYPPTILVVMRSILCRADYLSILVLCWSSQPEIILDIKMLLTQDDPHGLQTQICDFLSRRPVCSSICLAQPNDILGHAPQVCRGGGLEEGPSLHQLDVGLLVIADEVVNVRVAGAGESANLLKGHGKRVDVRLAVLGQEWTDELGSDVPGCPPACPTSPSRRSVIGLAWDSEQEPVKHGAFDTAKHNPCTLSQQFRCKENIRHVNRPMQAFACMG